nr:S8/S53 family peptidase [Lachnospiraceae bacterium]
MKYYKGLSIVMVLSMMISGFSYSANVAYAENTESAENTENTTGAENTENTTGAENTAYATYTCEEETDSLVSDSTEPDYSSKQLIVESKDEIENTYSATEVNTYLDEFHILTYDTEEETCSAYEALQADGVDVCVEEGLNVEDSMYNTDGFFNPEIMQDMGIDTMHNYCWANGDANTEVVVIDSGGYDVDTYGNPFNRITDPDNTFIGYQYVNGKIKKTEMPVDYSIDSGELNNLHSTRVTSIILDSTGDNIKVRCCNVATKYYVSETEMGCTSSTGETSTEYLLSLYDELYDEAKDSSKDYVINFSMAMTTESDREMSYLKRATKKLIRAGVPFVVAAGNDSSVDTSTTYPQCISEVINVGGLKKENGVYTRAKFTSPGSSDSPVDYSASGYVVDVTGESVSGTSFSAPL